MRTAVLRRPTRGGPLHPAPTFGRRLPGLALALAAATLAACADMPTGSHAVPAPVANHAPPEQDLGTSNVPVPTITKGSTGDLPWAGTGTSPIPVNRWAIIRVTGSLTLQPNSPAYDPLCGGSTNCYPRSGELIRPTTSGNDVGISLGTTAEPTTQNVSQRWLYVPSSGDQNVGEYFMYNSTQGNYYVWRTRPGPPGGLNCSDTSCYPGSGTTGSSWTEQYRYSGTQSLSVTLVTPITVNSTGNTVYRTSNADSVTYTMQINHGLRAISSGRASSISWQYVYYDTLATTNNNTTGFPFVDVYACMNQTTCRYRNTIPGRMLVLTTLENTWASGKSEVLRAVDSKLGVTCPDTVIAGANTTCTAYTSPNTAFTVTAWTYVGDTTGVTQGATGDLKTWTFQPTECGDVTVQAQVGGVSQSATDPVVVVCDFFSPSAKDPLLNSVRVQQAMKRYWASSNPGDPSQANRREQGGYIVRHRVTGELYVEPFSSNSNPDVCGATPNGNDLQSVNAWGDVIAYFHTHPHTPGATPPTTCHTAGAQYPGAQFGDGPSLPDYNAVNDPTWPVPDYVVDFDHVHEIKPGEHLGDPYDTENRSTTCTS
jgi:hypothetical protein